MQQAGLGLKSSPALLHHLCELHSKLPTLPLNYFVLLMSVEMSKQ